MKLKNVRVMGFRSIDEVAIEEIGDLNVLIGKNNSGKSNLLISINSFFLLLVSIDDFPNVVWRLP